MSDINEGWMVYEHVFPDGKSYIGITGKDAESRWENGFGYKNQPKVWAAIQQYGWDNVEHRILADNLSAPQACAVEKAFIRERDSQRNGYNANEGGTMPRRDSYLSSSVLGHLQKQKTDPLLSGATELAELIVKAREEPEQADFWNDADEAISAKYGCPENSIDSEIMWWQHLMDYCNLHIELNTSLNETHREAESEEPHPTVDYDFIKSIVYEVLQEIEDTKAREFASKKEWYGTEFHRTLTEKGWYS